MPVEKHQKAPALWRWPTFASIGLAILILIFSASMVDLKAVWREIANSEKRFVLYGALFHYATYALRGMRWRRCLIHLPVAAGNGKFAILVFFYNFADNLVPAKLGDIYAAHLARINFKIRRSAALGSIVFLRMIDAWTVLFLAALVSWLLFAARSPRSVLWALIGGGVLAIGATTVMIVFYLFKRSLPAWLPQKIQQMIRSFQEGMWPRTRQLLPIAGLTAAIWTFESLWIFFLTLAFDLKLGSAQVIFLTMIPLLASAFPFTPSGAGMVEITLYSCLKVLGIAAPLAASLTLVNRFMDYWLHIGLGLLAWALRHILGFRTWRDISPLEFNSEHATDITTEHGIVHDN